MIRAKAALDAPHAPMNASQQSMVLASATEWKLLLDERRKAEAKCEGDAALQRAAATPLPDGDAGPGMPPHAHVRGESAGSYQQTARPACCLLCKTSHHCLAEAGSMAS